MSIKTGPGKSVPVEVIPKALSCQEYMRYITKSTEREVSCLAIGQRDVLHLLQDCDDPFYLMDIGRLVDLYNLWKNFFPRIKPHYGELCNKKRVMLYINNNT